MSENQRLSSLINALAADEAKAALMKCCGSSKWASKMVQSRPFSSDQALFGTADSIWNDLEREDFLEAFTHHPPIGASVESLRKKFPNTATWSAGEQSGVAQAAEETLAQLAQGNQDYLAKFGYIFLICASGKSASEMLSALQSRLHNKADAELLIAAGEQQKITTLRLEKLCP